MVDSNDLCLTGCSPIHRFLFSESDSDCWDPYDEKSVFPDDCWHEWWNHDEANVFTSLDEAHRIAGLATQADLSGAVWHPQPAGDMVGDV